MRWMIVLGLVLSATAAAAEAPFAGEGLFRPPVEWSTWVRGGYGATRGQRAPFAARTLTPPAARTEGTWELGAGIEASLALSKGGDLRAGGWLEVRGFSRADVFAGGELVLTRVPRRWDMFLYEGHGILAARVGRSTTHETAALAFGYLAPYWLEGPCRVRFFDIETGVCAPRPKRHARYMTGVRVVGTVTRAIDDPRAWSATLGLELETAGALRMLLGLRAWY